MRICERKKKCILMFLMMVGHDKHMVIYKNAKELDNLPIGQKLSELRAFLCQNYVTSIQRYKKYCVCMHYRGLWHLK